jgi:hypothetical protein
MLSQQPGMLSQQQPYFSSMGALAQPQQPMQRQMFSQPSLQMPFDVGVAGGSYGGHYGRNAAGELTAMWRKLLDPQGNNALEFFGSTPFDTAQGQRLQAMRNPSFGVNYLHRF